MTDRVRQDELLVQSQLSHRFLIHISLMSPISGKYSDAQHISKSYVPILVQLCEE